MPANQKRSGAVIGFLNATTPFNQTLAFSAANTWQGWSFVSVGGKTLTQFTIYVSAVTGSPTASDFTAEVYSDSGSGTPNASVAGPVNADATPAAGVWASFTFNYVCQPGTRYWIVLKCPNAAAGRYVTVQHSSSTALSPYAAGNLATLGWVRNHTTDGGTTWPNGAVGVAGPRWGFSDGSYDGLPTGDVGVGAPIYGTTYTGVAFTTPANVSLVIAGVSMNLNKVGTPAALTYKLYTGPAGSPTLQGTTQAIPAGNLATAYAAPAYFASPITIAPNTEVRLVIAQEADGGTSANYYRTYEYTIEDSAASKALYPYSVKKTVSTDSGATFTDTDTIASPFALILDTDGEFVAAGGGGSGSGGADKEPF